MKRAIAMAVWFGVLVHLVRSAEAWPSHVARGAASSEEHATSSEPVTLPAPRTGDAPVSVRQLDASMYVHESRDANGTPSNGLVVVRDGGLLLVDTAWTDEQTDRILDWGTRALGRPWMGAIITHEHRDRDGGIAAVAARKIPIAAGDLTVTKLEARGIHGVAKLFASGGGRAHDDPRGFQAFFPGPGHAPDNIVLWFDESKVLYGGCLVKSAEAKDLGFTGDADLSGWPAAVKSVAARYQPRFVVPGHGSVGSKALLAHTLDLLAAARRN